MKDAHSISTRRAYGVQRVCACGTAPALGMRGGRRQRPGRRVGGGRSEVEGPLDLHAAGVWRAAGLPRVAPRPL